MVWKMTWRIWQIFTTVHEGLKIGTFIGSFYPKKKMCEVKIYKGVMYYNNDEWYKIWKGIDLSIQNWHEEVNKFCSEHSKISKIYTLMGYFWLKYIMFKLQNYRGVMFDGNKYWCKIWRKTDLCFQKWHEEFSKFSPEQLLSKLGLSWHPFVQSWKCMSLKFIEELCVMTMNNDAKFEEELTWRTWQILQGNGLFLTKVFNVWAKGSPEELFLMEVTIDAKFEGKLTCAS